MASKVSIRRALRISLWAGSLPALAAVPTPTPTTSTSSHSSRHASSPKSSVGPQLEDGKFRETGCRPGELTPQEEREVAELLALSKHLRTLAPDGPPEDLAQAPQTVKDVLKRISQMSVRARAYYAASSATLGLTTFQAELAQNPSTRDAYQRWVSAVETFERRRGGVFFGQTSYKQDLVQLTTTTDRLVQELGASPILAPQATRLKDEVLALTGQKIAGGQGRILEGRKREAFLKSSGALVGSAGALLAVALAPEVAGLLAVNTTRLAKFGTGGALLRTVVPSAVMGGGVSGVAGSASLLHGARTEADLGEDYFCALLSEVNLRGNDVLNGAIESSLWGGALGAGWVYMPRVAGAYMWSLEVPKRAQPLVLRTLEGGATFLYLKEGLHPTGTQSDGLGIRQRERRERLEAKLQQLSVSLTEDEQRRLMADIDKLLFDERAGQAAGLTWTAFQAMKSPTIPGEDGDGPTRGKYIRAGIEWLQPRPQLVPARVPIPVGR
jgi:hypothetical protein